MSGKKIKITIGIIIIIVALCFAVFYWMTSPVEKNNDSQVIVKIEQGSGIADIANTLEDKGLVKSALGFRVKVKISGEESKLQAGTYALERSMSMDDIINIIATGKTAGKTFTIVEGLTLDKIADQLVSQNICTKKDFYKEVKDGSFDYKFMKYLPKGATRLEGFLYPNTYSIALGSSAHEAIDAMLKQFDNVVTSDYYTAAKKMNMNIFEIVTVASIIERESSKTSDKAKVASVIYNRLDKNMYLQMDSIISYINKEDKVIATYGDIAVDSDYNPYKNKGLPPGPICSPGIKSIYAALNPDDTKYLYFVNSSKLNGSLAFAETDTEFAKDKAAFEKAYAKYLKEHPEEK